MMKKTITRNDFSRMFKIDPDEMPRHIVRLTESYDLSYRPAELNDLEEYVLNFLKLEDDDRLERTRQQNYQAFEKGWSSNLEQLKRSAPAHYQEALKPGYFRGSRFFRYNNQLVVTDNYQLEYELFLIARHCIFHKWIADARVVCELGCGTCANLLLFSEARPDVSLIGLDWAASSREIADYLGEKLGRPVSGHVFNMLEPDKTVEIPAGSAIISIHAFEQLGRQFDAVLDFIIAKQPSIVIQYEPVLDFYNPDSLLDVLALRYCKKRGYLEGYYGRLCELEQKGTIEILEASRPYLGGVLHESSLIVWRPSQGNYHG